MSEKVYRFPYLQEGAEHNARVLFSVMGELQHEGFPLSSMYEPDYEDERGTLGFGVTVISRDMRIHTTMQQLRDEIPIYRDLLVTGTLDRHLNNTAEAPASWERLERKCLDYATDLAHQQLGTGRFAVAMSKLRALIG